MTPRRIWLTLGLAYFAFKNLPTGFVEIPLEYFEAASASLAKRDGVKSQAIGLVGGSRGGERRLTRTTEIAKLL